jgi:drug/metabolite transporter (DMT)-like permease
MTPTLRWLKLCAVLVLWAISFILNEVALRDVGPAAIVAGRWLVTAGLVVGLLARGQGLGTFVSALQRDWRRLLMLSLVGVSLLYGLQVAGQARTTAINTGLLANMVPIFTALLAAILLGERLRPAGWAGIFLALAGAWMVSAGGLQLQVSAESALGDAMVLLSALSASLYFVLGKDLLRAYPPLIVTAAAAVLGAATLLPIALAEGSWRNLTWSSALAVLVLGIGPGLLANLWWWETAEWLDASRAAIYVNIIPVITLTLAVLLLNETVGAVQLAGASLVLAGVWLAERSSAPSPVGG